MSKDKLVEYLTDISKNDQDDLSKWSSMTDIKEGILHNGNIWVRIDIHTEDSQNLLHCVQNETFLEVQSFCNKFNIEGGLSMITLPTVNSQPDLWQVHISYQNLIHMWGKCQLSTEVVLNDLNSGSDDNIYIMLTFWIKLNTTL